MRKKIQPSLFERCFPTPRESPVIWVPDFYKYHKGRFQASSIRTLK